MKKLITTAWMGLLCCLWQSGVSAQEYKTHISKQFNLPGGFVGIYNVSGPVKIEGYEGDQVLIDIEETITANDPGLLRKGKKEVKVAFEQKAGSVLAYLISPSDARPDTTGKKGGKYHAYQFVLAFTVKVPYATNIEAKTVNNGDIRISNITGALRLNNVNGDITVAGAKGTTHARTVNGKITAGYSGQPTDSCSYRTLNGEIRVTYPADLAADLLFKSRNGKFSTDFEQTGTLLPDAAKIETAGGGTAVYRSSASYGIRIGKGGPFFRFENLNGDIVVQKQP